MSDLERTLGAFMLKRRNASTASLMLDDLETRLGVDAADSREALADYNDLDRADYSDQVEYREDRDGAWGAFLDALADLEEPER